VYLHDGGHDILGGSLGADSATTARAPPGPAKGSASRQLTLSAPASDGLLQACAACDLRVELSFWNASEPENALSVLLVADTHVDDVLPVSRNDLHLFRQM